MKKDLFNGRVKEKDIKYVKMNLILCPTVSIIISLALLFISLFLPLRFDAKIATLVLAVIGLLFGITYPFITVSLIRKHPKFKKLTNLFISGNVFKDDIT